MVLIGIQPKSLAFGQGVSPEVTDAIAETEIALRASLGTPASAAPEHLSRLRRRGALFS